MKWRPKELSLSIFLSISPSLYLFFSFFLSLHIYLFLSVFLVLYFLSLPSSFTLFFLIRLINSLSYLPLNFLFINISTYFPLPLSLPLPFVLVSLPPKGLWNTRVATDMKERMGSCSKDDKLWWSCMRPKGDGRGRDGVKWERREEALDFEWECVCFTT